MYDDTNQRVDMGRKEHFSGDIDDRNITAPDSDDGEIEEITELVNPYNETKHPPKVVTSRYDHVEDDVKLPHSRLHKRHNAPSFHRVREGIASKVVQFHHISGIINPADILSKHWGYTQSGMS